MQGVAECVTTSMLFAEHELAVQAVLHVKHCSGAGAAHHIWQTGGMARPAKRLSSSPLLSPRQPWL